MSNLVLDEHLAFDKQVIGDRLVILAEQGATLAIGSQGVVIGSLYEGGRAVAVTRVDDDTVRLIMESRGDRLTRAYWGSYVALLSAAERQGVEVVRGPFGDLACYIHRTALGVFVASDVDLLIAFADFTPVISWSALAQHLAAPELPHRRTCLANLDELAGGERMLDDVGGQTIDAPWSIWGFAESTKRLTDVREAALRVRDAIQAAVGARAGVHDMTVLRLSGGLDSSVVAACLANANRRFVALTLVTHDHGGDERTHARAVAAHLGVPLIEKMREIGDVDLAVSAALGLPIPSARGFAQAGTSLANAVARDHHATAVFDGGGGDNMFASLQSPAPVVDCLRSDGGTGLFWQTARSIGIAARTSTFEVARRALIRSWSRGPAYRWPVDLSLLSGDARESAQNAADHPWLIPPFGALAGSAAHIALLAAADSVSRSRDVRVDPPGISPLIAQPVAEACLRVPGWLWTRDGHNRVVVRDAFRAALPETIIDRRDKGMPDSFVVELVEANRDLIRSMLIDGLLAKGGLLDSTALATALTPTNLLKGLGYVRLMQLVDAEAWVRSWHGSGWASG